MKTLEDIVLDDSEQENPTASDGIEMLGLLDITAYTHEIIGAANKYLAALSLIRKMREMLRDPMD